jgi:hypothetical protein
VKLKIPVEVTFSIVLDERIFKLCTYRRRWKNFLCRALLLFRDFFVLVACCRDHFWESCRSIGRFIEVTDITKSLAYFFVILQISSKTHGDHQLFEMIQVIWISPDRPHLAAWQIDHQTILWIRIVPEFNLFFIKSNFGAFKLKNTILICFSAPHYHTSSLNSEKSLNRPRTHSFCLFVAAYHSLRIPFLNCSTFASHARWALQLLMIIKHFESFFVLATGFQAFNLSRLCFLECTD